jgi:hypothetical protein
MGIVPRSRLSNTGTPKNRKTTSEKPVKIPLDFKEALAALLGVKTKPPAPKKKPEKKQKPGD